MMGKLVYKCLGCGQVYADPTPVGKTVFVMAIAKLQLHSTEVKIDMKSIHKCNEISLGVSELIRWDEI